MSEGNRLVYVVPTSYPNPDNMVANSFVQEQVKAIKKTGCEVVVLNVQKQPTKLFFKRIDTKIYKDYDGVSTVYRCKCKTFVEKSFPLLNQIFFSFAMKRLYRSAVIDGKKPDVVYAHFFKAGLSSLRIVKKDKIPVVVMEHSGELMNERLKNIEKFFLRETLKESDAYICTTDNLKKHVLKITKTNKKILTIPNVVDDLFIFSPCKNNRMCFFSLARLEYDKRIDLLISAFCEAFNENEDVVLKIGGVGPEYNKLNHLVFTNHREHQILFLGKLDRERVYDEMKNCSCFVLPSRHETFGLVWREALCVGRPVITTDHGGFSNNDWSDEYGIMIDVDDKKQLVDALKKMFISFHEYDLKFISDENRKRYDMTNIGVSVRNILEKAITEK